MYKHLLTQRINIQRIDGTDENGMPAIIEEKSNVPCKIWFKNKIIINSIGQQQTSEGGLIIQKEIYIGDVILFNNRQFTALSVSPLYDFEGKLQAYSVLF